jgi:selenocysteine-specific elongation factor
MRPDQVHVVATAGHVDHGKSTLVLALTGTDTDRLEEEKRRGLTIDLGFAWTTLPSGKQVDFVDVPGHSRFIKNALAGIGSINACLFVVAATEGWKAQSEEHLRILELLGISKGVVAITKSTLVDDERLLRVVDEVGENLRNSTLATAPIVLTDAPGGVGLGELIGTLDDVLERTPHAVDRGRPRLWIDRSFSKPGSGTVVTGTLVGGSVAVGDELHLVPGESPSYAPTPVRIRSIQTHSRALQSVRHGHRIALAIIGCGRGRVDSSHISRGNALVRLSQWEPTTTVDASLRVISSAPTPIRRRGAYHAHIGSGAYAVRLQVLGNGSVWPGNQGCVRMRLPEPLPLIRGDRYILRDSGRDLTIGGGEVLDVRPVLGVSQAHPDHSVDRIIAEHGWITAEELERITGERRLPTLKGGWIVSPQEFAAVSRMLLERAIAAGWSGLDIALCTDRERAVLEVLVSEHRLTINASRVYKPRPIDSEDHPYLRALKESPFAPPDPVQHAVDRIELTELIAAGFVVEHEGRCFAASAIRDAEDIVSKLLLQHPAGITVSMVRERLGTTRKYAVPLLAILDERGITHREGPLRISGSSITSATT